jgi:ribonuclease HI
LDLERNLEKTYAWGLRKATNNQVEACALYLGIILAEEVSQSSLIFIGDSSTIINLMVSKKSA